MGRRIPKAPPGCPGRFAWHPALGGTIKKPFNQCKAMSISCRNLKTIRAFIQNRPGTCGGRGPELLHQREAALAKRRKRVSTARRGEFLPGGRRPPSEGCVSPSSLAMGNPRRERRAANTWTPLGLPWKGRGLPRKSQKLLQTSLGYFKRRLPSSL